MLQSKTITTYQVVVDFGTDHEAALAFDNNVWPDEFWSVIEPSWSEERRGTNYVVSGRHKTATHCTCPDHDAAKGNNPECKHMRAETERRRRG